jgi:ketosteroid isomerase-like protein
MKGKTMSDNTDIVRNFYAALGCGDVPAVLALFDAGIEWTEAERFPYYGGTWRGPDAIVKGLFEPLGRDWSKFSVEPQHYIAEGEETISLGRYAGTHKQTGRSMTAPFAHHWTVRAGKIVRFVQYTDTAKVLEAVQ